MRQEDEREVKPKQINCCVCPYCDADFSRPLPTCQVCGHQLRYCSECGAAVKKDDAVCPNCGATRVTAGT
jgi:hypothetical protein